MRYRSLVRRALSLGCCLALAAACSRDRGHAPAPVASASVTAATSAHAPAASASAAHVEPAPKPIDRVVLLTIDAMRADQPWTGYAAANTPHLSRLAEQSVVYTRAYSLANTTLPSLSAMMTARYPTELERDDCPLPWVSTSDGLASALHDAGVRTMAAHGHAAFDGPFAPSAGFDDWRVIDHVGARRAVDGAVTGEAVADLLIDELSHAPEGARVFAWAHFLDPHDSYVAHADFPASADPRRGLYDGEVAYTDDVLGRVLDALDASALADHTAIIVTADHGEAFGEHERFRHGYTVYDEEVRVPLVLRIPGVRHRRIDAVRSTIDLARTVVDLYGVAPRSTWRGRSLLADFGAHKPERRTAIVDAPELLTGPGRRAVIHGRHKTILFGNQATVFDLEDDPRERRPLVGEVATHAAAEARAAVEELKVVRAKPCQRKAFRGEGL